MPTTCNFIDQKTGIKCSKNAGYCLPGTTQRLRCRVHAEPGMKSTRVDSRVCQHTDHATDEKRPRASYNFPDEKKPIYCKTHATDGMVHVNNHKHTCDVCRTKIPSFGMLGNKATHCANCKTIGMVDLVSKLCEEKGCSKNATYGFLGQGHTRCKPHALPGMRDLKNKKQPNSDSVLVSDSKSDTPDLVLAQKQDNVEKSCSRCGLTFTGGEIYGKNKNNMICQGCKMQEMKDVKHPQCEGCKTHTPSYNYNGQTKARFCSGCKKDGMVNVISPRCASCGLFIVLSTKKLCSYCMPESTKRQKTKEMEVVTFLQEHKIDFVHNKSSGFVCGNYRPDIKIDAGTHLVIVEIDEDQHSQYDQGCEIARMYNIYQSEGLPCVFIRYNPDAFYLDGGAFIVYTKRRLQVLLEQIRYHMTTVPTENLTVFRMFYSQYNYNTYKNAQETFVQKFDIARAIENIIKQAAITNDMKKDEEETQPALGIDKKTDDKAKRCKSCNLFIVSHASGLCVYCTPGSERYQKTKEITAVNYMTKNELKFIHNESVGFSDGRFFPDIKISTNTHVVVVEIDEDQHSSYDQNCEITRMINIYQAQKEEKKVPYVFIRFNPDVFRVKGKVVRIPEVTRLSTLVAKTYFFRNTVPTENLSVYRLFYNNDTGEHMEKYDIRQESANILSDPEFRLIFGIEKEQVSKEQVANECARSLKEREIQKPEPAEPEPKPDSNEAAFKLLKTCSAELDKNIAGIRNRSIYEPKQ